MTGRDAVVVPVISTGSSVTCFRSLGRRGVRTVGVGDPPFAASARSKYCDETRRVPSPRDDVAGYADALLDLAERPDVATVVPLREPDIYVLSKHRDAFGERVGTPWPDFDSFQTASDGFRLFERARDAGVGVPRTAPVDEWDGWDGVTVVKPRHSLTPDGDGLRTDGPRFFGPDEPPDGAAIESLSETMGHVPMAQEYVPGDREHGFFALCDRGEPVVTFQHRRVRSYKYAGGASTFRKSVDVPELAAAGERLLRELDWHGPAMVEFKHDPRDDEFKLMEVNPRFWGSLPLAYAAGVDFPARYYELATGELDRPADGFETGVGCHRLRGEVSYLASVLTERYDHLDRPSLGREGVAVLRSLVSDPHFDYLSADDPRPFVHDILGAAGDLLT